MSSDSNLIGPDDVAFHMELTAREMKITFTALKIFFDGLGHEEHDVKEIVRAVLDKLPDEHAIRSIVI